MDLTFRILWFEDSDEWYKSMSRRVSKHIEENNFIAKIDRIKKPSDFDLKKYNLHNYDLLIVDYDLETICENNIDRKIYGTEIIKLIRHDDFVNDILFYSALGFSKIYEIFKSEGLQGVFISDRKNEEFYERVKKLANKTITRANNIVNIRGVVMDTTSNFDNMICDLIIAIWPTLGGNEGNISEYIKKEILNGICKTSDKLKERYVSIDGENIESLLGERDFSAARQVRVLNKCIELDSGLREKLSEALKKHLHLENGEEKETFFNLYNKDIINYRNALAHVKTEISIEDKDVAVEINGETVIFNQELCNNLRRNLLNYKNILDDINEYVVSKNI